MDKIVIWGGERLQGERVQPLLRRQTGSSLLQQRNKRAPPLRSKRCSGPLQGCLRRIHHSWPTGSRESRPCRHEGRCALQTYDCSKRVSANQIAIVKGLQGQTVFRFRQGSCAPGLGDGRYRGAFRLRGRLQTWACVSWSVGNIRTFPEKTPGCTTTLPLCLQAQAGRAGKCRP